MTLEAQALALLREYIAWNATTEQLDELDTRAKAIVAKYEELQSADKADAAHIQWARYNRADDELEIDDEPRTSRGDDEGTWVAAWVWVYDTDANGSNPELPR